MEEKTQPEQATSVKKPIKTEVLNVLYKELSKPIDKQFLISYTQDGKEFTGYHAQYAIDLLNEVVGLGNWHTLCDIYKQELIGKGWVIGGMITILINYEGVEFAVNGYGGSYAKNIANAYKGFKTSAFKNACRYLGIGRELYIAGFEDDVIVTEEVKEVEIIEGNDLANRIDLATTVAMLSDLKDSLEATEGSKVKDVLFKKYNEKMIALIEQK